VLQQWPRFLTACNVNNTQLYVLGLRSSVGIESGYGLDGPGIEFSGFGGRVVSMLASGTQDRGFAPDRSTSDFSFGGEVK
jgi:hypothetical protein